MPRTLQQTQALFAPVINNATASGFSKKMIYDISRWYSDFNIENGVWEPHNTIIDGRFYLGMLPLNRHQDKLFALLQSDRDPGGLIISCNSFFELAPGDVIPVNKFSDRKIDHHLLLMADFGAEVENALALYTLNKMMDAHTNNVPIYIHCKAGRGRSGMLATVHFCQLILNGDVDAINILKINYPDLNEKLKEINAEGNGLDHATSVELYDAAYASLKKLRHNLGVSSGQRNTGIELLKALRNPIEIDDNFLFLNAIIQSPAFKNLSKELFNLATAKVSGKPVRVSHIEKILKDILSNDEGWYQRLANPKEGEPLYGFINAEPLGAKIGSFFGGNQLSELHQHNDKLISSLRTAVDEAALAHPNSDYAKQRQSELLTQPAGESTSPGV